MYRFYCAVSLSGSSFFVHGNVATVAKKEIQPPACTKLLSILKMCVGRNNVGHKMKIKGKRKR